MSFRVNVNNILETHIRELNSKGFTSFEYEELYDNISNEKLKTVFAWLHAEYIRLFKLLNQRLPTAGYTAHFWAEPSRELIYVIELTISLQSSLRRTELAFSIDEYYESVIKQCREFLSNSGGSEIPTHMQKITLCYVEPIFHLTESIVIPSGNNITAQNLRNIGEGSYAKVFRYTDDFYKKDFVLKRAKPDLDPKELIRFKREYEQMASMNSPYVVEVYSFNESKNEYIMEFMDCTLEQYMKYNHDSMTLQTRRSIISQLIRAFKYIHSKEVYHRDISFKNVLIKQYDDVLVVKLADFGLVKIINSDLTSVDTDVKGSLNDPSLIIEGFENYGLLHEIYAITLLFVYILSGKSNFSKITEPNVKAFMSKGTDQNKAKRFQTLDELSEGVFKCINDIEKNS